jgi:hypothetical protein
MAGKRRCSVLPLGPACAPLASSMIGHVLTRFYNRVVSALSFGAEYQKMRRWLNERIDSPESIEDFPPSHPAGFVRELKKRRISIVESYLIMRPGRAPPKGSLERG